MTPEQVIELAARDCARPIRGCATDDQYTDVVNRVAEVIRNVRLAGFHEGRDAAAMIAENEVIWADGLNVARVRGSPRHAAAIRKLEPPKAEDRSRQEKTSTKDRAE